MAGRCRSCQAWNSDEGRSPTPRRRSQSGTRWRREGRLIRLFIPEFERALEVIAFPRWAMISVAGATVATGAPVACLVAGIISTPIADRLRLPFAAVAFASVVSLIPGVFQFGMTGGLVGLIALGGRASP